MCFPTGEVVVLLAVCISKGDQLSEQQGVLKDPLHRFNQVRLQGGRVLLSRVPCIQELFKGLIRLCFNLKKNIKSHEIFHHFIIILSVS